jgi:hypothetical protein
MSVINQKLNNHTIHLNANTSKIIKIMSYIIIKLLLFADKRS